MGCIVAGLVVWLVIINVTEILEGNNLPQTVSASECRNIDYFKDFCMLTFDGDYFTEEDLQEGDIFVFNAWGPFCSSCLAEMPELDEINYEYEQDGLRIIGIQAEAYLYPEDIEKSMEKAEATGVSYPLLMADEAFTNELYPMLENCLPGTWVVNSDGVILDFVAGAKSKEGWEDYFEQFLY